MESLFNKMRLVIRYSVWFGFLFCVVQISGCWFTEEPPRIIKVKIEGNKIECRKCYSFGSRIELGDDQLLIGNEGMIFIFERQAGRWVKIQEIKGDGEYPSVSEFTLTPSLLAVSITDNLTDLEGPVVHLFERAPDGTWVKFQELRGVDPYAYFGQSIHISNDRMIIGSPDGLVPYEGDINHGHAFIYKLQGKQWTLEATLTSHDPHPDDNFGNSVSLVGDYAVVTGDLRDGPVEVFKQEGSGWVFHKYLENSEGVALSSSGNHLMAVGHRLTAFTVKSGSGEFIPRSIEMSGEYFPNAIFHNTAFGEGYGDPKEHVKMHGNYAIVSGYFGKVLLLKFILDKWNVYREFEFWPDDRSAAFGIAVSDDYVAVQSGPQEVTIFPK